MKINNKIKEDYCSFEVSKLLRDKGFNCETNTCYGNDGKFQKRSNSYEYNGNEFYYADDDYLISAPTHGHVIKWIRENFGVQLFLCYEYCDGFHYGYKWCKKNGDYGELWQENEGIKPDGFDTELKATEAILTYCLKNLI